MCLEKISSHSAHTESERRSFIFSGLGKEGSGLREQELGISTSV